MNKAITRSKGNKFNWSVIGGVIKFESAESSSKGEFTSEVLQTALSDILVKFSYNTFPLANNVADVPSGTSVDGLGVALHSAGYNKPSDASFLGPIMEQIGVFEYVPSTSATTWRLSINTNSVVIDNVIDIAGVYS